MFLINSRVVIYTRVVWRKKDYKTIKNNFMFLTYNNSMLQLSQRT